MMPFNLPLSEEERQVVMMALAALSVERPGWDDMLNRIAIRIDNDKGGRGELFDVLRGIRLDANARRTTR